ncbi:hypothetical protein HG549_16360 [Pseudomonas sp. SK]|uniref:hypothetical protein n=1 Tax=Pseudomonas sp. SK TaxID=2729423 RepID=UPI001463C9E2|nr:hypothetical protein [Pseudomonas sp. SK]QJQ21431.1 hypothetical protein HG549_16360 [Pseudomonas sp. SK]
MASLLDEQLGLFVQALMGTLRLGGYGLVHKSYLLVGSRRKRLRSQYTGNLQRTRQLEPDTEKYHQNEYKILQILFVHP